MEDIWEDGVHKVYFDTEFTGLHQHTKLISMGMVSEEGHTFYSECNKEEYENGFENDSDKAFFQEHIEPHLKWKIYGQDGADTFKQVENNQNGVQEVEVYGCIDFVSGHVENWLKTVAGGSQIRMWSDTYAYDWMFFCQLWGHARNIPSFISYIPMDLSTFLYAHGVDPDVSREEFAGYTDVINKHNALHDALVIKACVEKVIAVKKVEPIPMPPYERDV